MQSIWEKQITLKLVSTGLGIRSGNVEVATKYTIYFVCFSVKTRWVSWVMKMSFLIFFS